MSNSALSVSVELSGGAELLFGNVKSHSLSLPILRDGSTKASWHVKDLLVWIKDHLLQEREELFLKDDSVRPGILVLINDSDWELLGQLDYILEEGDVITFISTLHGG